MDYIINNPNSNVFTFPENLSIGDRLIFNNTSEGRSGTIIEWTAPSNGIFKIEACGAQGGIGDRPGIGGLGAKMSGDFDIEEGQIISILVGQRGGNQGSNPGGGGGTFVIRKSDIIDVSNILLIAGGGGGYAVGNTLIYQGIAHAHTETFGKDGYGTYQQPGLGGLNGGHGGNSEGGGGGGFLTSAGGRGGQSFLQGAFGGTGGNSNGGFGCGGGGGGSGGFGSVAGGGGFSGGGGAFSGSATAEGAGGGGGSYNIGENQDNESGVHDGHGQVIITLLEVPGNFSVKIQGFIYKSGEVLEGATVYAIDTTHNILLGPVFSDSVGKYEFEGLSKDSTYHIFAHYSNDFGKYRSKSYPFIIPIREVPISGMVYTNSGTEADLGVVVYTVTFTVFASERDPIEYLEGARVSVGDQVKFTDSLGIVDFEVTMGVHMYEVFLDNYVTLEGTFNMEGTNLNIEVGLEDFHSPEVDLNVIVGSYSKDFGSAGYENDNTVIVGSYSKDFGSAGYENDNTVILGDYETTLGNPDISEGLVTVLGDYSRTINERETIVRTSIIGSYSLDITVEEDT